MKVVTARQMQALDRETIEGVGIPGAVLMENAARGLARHLVDYCPAARTGRVVVLAGRGNNGGDGHAVARILNGWGARVEVFLLADPQDVSGDARINLDALFKLGIPVFEMPNEFADPGRRIGHADAVVDALFGTGLSKVVTGRYADAIERINRARGFVCSVDLPSGLSADSGEALGAAVHADLTVTFGLPKIAHVTYPGVVYCGDVEVVDIGIPPSVVDSAEIPLAATEAGEVTAFLGEPRTADAHKGHFGHLLVLAGSAGMTGAAVLTARAAARVGAGLVTCGIPQPIAVSVESRLLDAMTIPLSATRTGSFAETAATRAVAAAKQRSAIAIGPGLSTAGQTAKFVHSVLSRADVPAVVDADALNCIGRRHAVFKRRKAPTVLTPHPGEMARLTGRPTAEIQADRIGAARALASATGCVVLLKGAATVIANPDGEARINPTGNPGLATGGAGDVLTGLIGGLLAQGVGAFEAAWAGAYLHGLAADRAAADVGERALVAGDVIDALPDVLLAVEAGDPIG